MKNAIIVAVSLAFLAAVAYGLYFVAAKAWELLSAADATVGAAIIAASATVIVSTLSVTGARLLENRARVAEEHRIRKAPIYQKVQEFFFRVLFAQKMGEEPTSEAEIVKFFAELTPRLSVWGSDDVIRSFVEFRKHSIVTGDGGDQAQAIELMYLYEDFILKIRTDLGHSNTGLKSGDLLSLFITDIENMPRRPTR